MQQVLNKNIFTCPTQPLLAESPLVVCVANAAWDAEVNDDESSNAGPSEGQPLSLSAMATLVQVPSVWRYKYLFPLWRLIWIFGSTDWNFGVVENDSGWRIILEQDRKNKIKIVLFCSWALRRKRFIRLMYRLLRLMFLKTTIMNRVLRLMF